MSRIQHVFIIGSKGIPAEYGGFETFVEKLVEHHGNCGVYYHVACMGDGKEKEKVFFYKGAECFKIRVPEIGPEKAVYYDDAALRRCISFCRKDPSIQNPVFYVLACRIGFSVARFQKEIHSLGGKLFVNPDGHEWKRGKWSRPIKWYWKFSERMMVKHADLLICDSQHIRSYIQEEYKKYCPRTIYLAYGADVAAPRLPGKYEEFLKWKEKWKIHSGGYYLIVCRFVPENNFETMIREFMESDSRKDLVIITTMNPSFMRKLEKKLHFSQDGRIKFVGSVYDQGLLKLIRKNARGYLHGHEVGGTNPSLLEALGNTALNLVLDVGFNREVAEDTALYWTKSVGSLKELIHRADGMEESVRQEYGIKARKRIREAYRWEYIAKEYEKLFLSGGRIPE